MAKTEAQKEERRRWKKTEVGKASERRRRSKDAVRQRLNAKCRAYVKSEAYREYDRARRADPARAAYLAEWKKKNKEKCNGYKEKCDRTRLVIASLALADAMK